MMQDLIHSAIFSELAATICFVIAILHTFSVKFFQNLAAQYPEGSVRENLLHLFGEIEVVFGIWGAIFLGFVISDQGTESAIEYLESCNFTEPAFVFVILVVCATKPILDFGSALISGIANGVSKIFRISPGISLYFTLLTVGPLMGSFITEPAAMTITGMILLDRFYEKGLSEKLKYATLGLLFVNISIGGTLTPYAAPPVLMVARTWNWDLHFMLQFFGWKAALAILISTTLIVLRFRKELASLERNAKSSSATDDSLRVPLGAFTAGASPGRYASPALHAKRLVTMVHLFLLVLIVLSAHHLVVFGGIFLFFLGLTAVTKEYQTELKLREGLLVGFFLGGLVVLGGPQRWWLEPLLSNLNQVPLYLGSIGLTTVTDNAALTFLGAQVPNLAESSRYALVAGAVVGGGLTVIANAPNPAGYGILNPSFKPNGINPVGLLVSALIPTIISAVIFWFL